MIREQNAKIVTYLVLVILVISLSGCVQYNEKVQTSTNTSNETVIGALLPLTGELSYSGQAAKAVLELAAEDIEANGMKVRLVIEDTESNPAVALEKLNKFKGSGITLVIGPDSSKE